MEIFENDAMARAEELLEHTTRTLGPQKIWWEWKIYVSYHVSNFEHSQNYPNM